MPKLSKSVFPRPIKEIQVTPGQTVLPTDLRSVPAMGVFDWVARGDGSYYPRVRVAESWLRVSEAEKLPLGLSAEVIIKLWKGGFIQGAQPAPNNIVINIVSLLEHVEACGEDPHFWTTERRQKFRDGMAQF